MRHDCTNLLDSTGLSIPQKCNTCGAIEVSVWNCEERGTCAPFVKGTINAPGVIDCNSCQQYRSNGMFCKLKKIGRITYECEVCGLVVGTEFPKRFQHICSGVRAPVVEKEESEPVDTSMYCKLEKVGNMTYKCKDCGTVVGTSDHKRVKRVCLGEQPVVVVEEPEQVDTSAYCKLEKVGNMTYKCAYCDTVVGTSNPERVKRVCISPAVEVLVDEETDQSLPIEEEVEPEVDTNQTEESGFHKFLNL